MAQSSNSSQETNGRPPHEAWKFFSDVEIAHRLNSGTCKHCKVVVVEIWQCFSIGKPLEMSGPIFVYLLSVSSILCAPVLHLKEIFPQWFLFILNFAIDWSSGPLTNWFTWKVTHTSLCKIIRAWMNIDNLMKKQSRNLQKWISCQEKEVILK